MVGAFPVSLDGKVNLKLLDAKLTSRRGQGWNKDAILLVSETAHDNSSKGNVEGR